MSHIREVVAWLDRFAPCELAEEWDNVGLLVGDPDEPVARVMTCLTLTSESVSEAVARQANLVVAHHPLPFKPLKRLTTVDGTPGRLLWTLARAGVAVHSPHTAFDSTWGGINELLARGIGLENIAPLTPTKRPIVGFESVSLGAGRSGRFATPRTIRDIVATLRSFLNIRDIQIVGDPQRVVANAAVGCGSAAGFLPQVAAAGCELFVTGEASFHQCLEAQALGVTLLLPGHFATERFAVERLAESLAAAFPSLEVWASREERDPVAMAP